jgi:hypothetical protein
VVAARALRFDPIAEARRQWKAHGWEGAADGMAAVTSVFRAQQIYLARIDAIMRPLGLTFARYEVLMLLLFSRTGALPLSKVGDRLQVHPTSVNRDVFEQPGLDAAAVDALVDVVGELRRQAGDFEVAGPAQPTDSRAAPGSR